MAFGIGGSSSKTNSESQSYGYSGSSSFNFSDSSSLGTSSSGAQSTSTQNIAFADLFKQLYGGAASVAGGISGAPIGSAAEMLFSGGTDFLQSLEGGPAAGYLEQRISGESPVLQEQINALGSDLTSLFTNQLNPAITSRNVAGGTLGGGRQGVAQGVAMGEIARQFASGSTALRAADITARDTAANNLMAQRTAAAGVGLPALESLLGLKQSGSLADLAPYQALAQIFGGPTVMTQAQSTSESESFNTAEAVARAMSQAFGEDFATSKSSSRSKSGSISF